MEFTPWHLTQGHPQFSKFPSLSPNPMHPTGPKDRPRPMVFGHWGEKDQQRSEGSMGRHRETNYRMNACINLKTLKHATCIYINIGGIPHPLTVESEGFFRGPFIKLNRLLFHWHRGWGIPPWYPQDIYCIYKYKSTTSTIKLTQPASAPETSDDTAGFETLDAWEA